MQLFAGLDWGSERHAVCVIDDAGQVVVHFEAAHNAEGLSSMLKRLGKLAQAAELAEAKGELVKTLARVLETLVAEIAKLTSRIEHEVQQLEDGKLVMSFPRTGKLNAAQILAELGDVRERFQTEAQLAAEAGICPVTYESGKSRGVSFRWACNHRLRTAITTWADNSRHASPWAADIYARARARGCDHPHSVRILARAWVRVLWRAWASHTPYAPEQHGGARRFLAVA